jgi:hypothetical protein
LIDRREDFKQDDQVMKRADIDTSVIEQARQAEKKLKRLKMAKFS